jgi:hypothetical protein
VDINTEVIATLGATVVGAMAGLYAKAVRAENLALKVEHIMLKEQHTNDIARVENSQNEIWLEIKAQREALTQNREAVIRLNVSIERLNDILPRLEKVVLGVEGVSNMFYERRSTDQNPSPQRRWKDPGRHQTHDNPNS